MNLVNGIVLICILIIDNDKVIRASHDEVYIAYLPRSNRDPMPSP